MSLARLHPGGEAETPLARSRARRAESSSSPGDGFGRLNRQTFVRVRPSAQRRTGGVRQGSRRRSTRPCPTWMRASACRAGGAEHGPRTGLACVHALREDPMHPDDPASATTSRPDAFRAASPAAQASRTAICSPSHPATRAETGYGYLRRGAEKNRRVRSRAFVKNRRPRRRSGTSRPAYSERGIFVFRPTRARGAPADLPKVPRGADARRELRGSIHQHRLRVMEPDRRPRAASRSCPGFG